jgi:hypothetical protein
MSRKLFAVAFVAALLAASAAAYTAMRGRRSSPNATTTAAAADSPVRDAAANDRNGARMPVVVELFTSEGCSSCPPADALLARMDETQPVDGAEVIALAQHVDYWNSLGWSDPFSSHESSERQGEYARTFDHDGVYTPQMIVDGRDEFAGNDRDKAFDAIARAARAPKAVVTLAFKGAPATDGEGTLNLSVRVENAPKAAEGDGTDVLLAVTESNLSSDVSRGENSGLKLRHVGVVRRLTKIGELGAGAFSTETAVAAERGWRRENLRAVVFLQERASRRVVGAASIRLPS